VKNMIEQLFGSKTRFRLLRLFFRQPGQPFFVREISRHLGSQINAVRRELSLLVDLGIIKETAGQSPNFDPGSTLRKYYTLDASSLLYPELQGLLVKVQMLGEQEFVHELTEKGGTVRLMLLTGRFVNKETIPSDLLLVGDLKERNIAKLVAKYEKDLGFEVRYTLMSEKEFKERRHVMDKFLYTLFEAEHHKIVNELGV